MDTYYQLRELSLELAEKNPYLKLLVLFGSRGRGNNDSNSDWDFAVIYDKKLSGWDSLEVWSVLAKEFDLPENKIDVVNLEQCSPWLAHAIARDGKLLFEQEHGEFARFKQRSLKSEAELKAYQQAVKEKVRTALQRWKA